MYAKQCTVVLDNYAVIIVKTKALAEKRLCLNLLYATGGENKADIPSRFNFFFVSFFLLQRSSTVYVGLLWTGLYSQK